MGQSVYVSLRSLNVCLSELAQEDFEVTQPRLKQAVAAEGILDGSK